MNKWSNRLKIIAKVLDNARVVIGINKNAAVRGLKNVPMIIQTHTPAAVRALKNVPTVIRAHKPAAMRALKNVGRAAGNNKKTTTMILLYVLNLDRTAAAITCYCHPEYIKEYHQL